jgi:hypothetical protein
MVVRSWPVRDVYYLAMDASWTFHGEAREEWRDEDELQRSRDVAIPPFEIRFATTPDDATLSRLAEVTARHEPETYRVLWSGPFGLWELPGRDLPDAARRARRLVDALHVVAPVREVVFFAIDPRRDLDPGPAWNAPIRTVDRGLPPPAVRAAFERARRERRAAATPPRPQRVFLFGPRREVPELAEAVAKAGRPVRDREGNEHVVARITRFNFGSTDKPAHMEVGLVANGRWAVVVAFESEKDAGDPAKAIFPHYVAMTAHAPSQHRAQIKQGLANLGVHVPFPERELLLAELVGPAIAPSALAWIGPDYVPLDVELRALLEPRRSEPRIAAVLDARPSKPRKKKR